MLNRLDRAISIRVLLSAFPFAFLLHDMEEIATMERFGRENAGRFPRRWRGMARVTTPQIAWAVAFEFALAAVAAFLAAAPRPTRGPRLQFWNTAAAILFLNVLTHIGQAALFRGYTPGVTTSMLVSLPYTLYAFRRLRCAGLITAPDLYQALGAGALLGVPLVLISLKIGEHLAPRVLE